MDDRRRRELLEEQARREAARNEANATGRSRYNPETRLREIENRRAKEAEERRATAKPPPELTDERWEAQEAARWRAAVEHAKNLAAERKTLPNRAVSDNWRDDNRRR